jgi:hypothetical protein
MRIGGKKNSLCLNLIRHNETRGQSTLSLSKGSGDAFSILSYAAQDLTAFREARSAEAAAYGGWAAWNYCSELLTYSVVQ